MSNRSRRSAQRFATLGNASISGRGLWDRTFGRDRATAPSQFRRGSESFLVGLERFPKYCLLLFGGRSRICCRRLACFDNWARFAAFGNEIFPEKLDKVGWEQPHHASIAAQPTHPPLSVTSIQTLDQIPFNKPKVCFGLPSPRVNGSAPAREARWQLRSAKRHGGWDATGTHNRRV